MIISFSIENWMSFRDRVTFSMVASREKQHSNRVGIIKKYDTKVLPIAAIYGGNASGKTNFFKALSFVQQMVVRGNQPDDLIPVEIFKLDERVANEPARFFIEILVQEEEANIYQYSFAVTKNVVIEEKLVLLRSASEDILFDRRHGKPNFHKSIAKDQQLQIVFNGTRDNQLFINNSVSQKVDRFKAIYDWFKEVLVIIWPDSQYRPDHFGQEDHSFYSSMTKLLPMLDTGIVRFGGEDQLLDTIPISDRIKQQLREHLKEGMIAKLPDRSIVTKKNGELLVTRLNTYHSMTDGSEVKFDVFEESDGSQRIIDLLPALLELSTPRSKQVYIIDEIDRSLHTLLTRKLLESYLDRCDEDNRAQLLFTTHDVLLMDQILLRRDEMWVTERERSGNTKLYSFSEYKDVRYDKDIRKSYLQGRLGGIPRLLLEGALLK